MLSFLYNLFYKKSPDIRISFDINDINSSNVTVRMEYKDTSITTCQYIAKILFMLNKGMLMKDMIDAVNHLPLANQEFAIKLLKEWDKLYILENYNDPIISPSNAFSKQPK